MVGGVGGVGWGLHSHYIVKPNLVLRLGWGFDNIYNCSLMNLCLNHIYILNFYFIVCYLVDTKWLMKRYQLSSRHIPDISNSHFCYHHILVFPICSGISYINILSIICLGNIVSLLFFHIVSCIVFNNLYLSLEFEVILLFIRHHIFKIIYDTDFWKWSTNFACSKHSSKFSNSSKSVT